MSQANKRNEKFCNITIEVKKDFNEEVIRCAKREDISKSELVRRAIRKYISR